MISKGEQWCWDKLQKGEIRLNAKGLIQVYLEIKSG